MRVGWRKIATLVGAVALVGGGAVASRAQETAAPQEQLPYGALESFVEIHGFFDALYYQNGRNGLEEGNKTFDASEFYLLFHSNIHPQLDFNAELEYEHGGDEFTIRRLEINWKLWRGIELDFGKFYSPVGIEAPVHYAPSRKLVDRPYASRFIVPGIWPEVGVRLRGRFEPGGIGIIYEAAAVNGLAGPRRDDRQDRDNNDSIALAGRLAVRPLPWLTVGASGYEGAYDDGDDFLLRIRGLDLTVDYRGLNVMAEYLDSQVEIPPHDWVTRVGYYAQAAYRVKAPALKILYLEPAVRFDHLDEARELQAMTGAPDVDRVSTSLTVCPFAHFQLRGEYQWLWISEPDADTRPNYNLQAVVDF